MEQYLKEHSFDKHLEKLCKKLKNKTVTIYGTGKLFQTVAEKYDLTGLNITGVIDKKYTLEDEDKLFLDYKIISYEKRSEIPTDCIIVATQDYLGIIKYLQRLNPTKKIYPLIPLKLCERINMVTKKISKKFKKQNRNNTFVLIKENGKKVYFPKIKNLEIEFNGTDGYVEIHEPIKVSGNVKIFCGTNGKFILGKNCYFGKLSAYVGNNNTLTIGNKTTAENLFISMYTAQNQTVKIGEDCMISWPVQIRTNDSHTIYDINSGEILNPCADIDVGNHVWIGQGAIILKGAKIPSNCIVGAKSLVNKKFEEENCIIAGIPAKIIKRGVNWDRRGMENYKKSYNS